MFTRLRIAMALTFFVLLAGQAGAVSITQAVQFGPITADNYKGAYIDITKIGISEETPGEIKPGNLVFQLPPGFEFGAAPDVNVTKGNQLSANSPASIMPDGRMIVVINSKSVAELGTLEIGGVQIIQVRPSEARIRPPAIIRLVSGNISGVTNETSFGTLVKIAGAKAKIFVSVPSQAIQGTSVAAGATWTDQHGNSNDTQGYNWYSSNPAILEYLSGNGSRNATFSAKAPGEAKIYALDALNATIRNSTTVNITGGAATPTPTATPLPTPAQNQVSITPATEISTTPILVATAVAPSEATQPQATQTPTSTPAPTSKPQHAQAGGTNWLLIIFIVLAIAGAVAAYFAFVQPGKKPGVEHVESKTPPHHPHSQKPHHYTQQTLGEGHSSQAQLGGNEEEEEPRPLREYGEKFPRSEEKVKDEKPPGTGYVLYKGNIVPLQVKVKFGADNWKDDAKKKKK